MCLFCPCAGVFVQLCVPGILGLCSALQPVPASCLQCLHCVDVCHHRMQNVVPAEVYKPAIILQKLLYGDYTQKCFLTLVISTALALISININILNFLNSICCTAHTYMLNGHTNTNHTAYCIQIKIILFQSK